MALSSRKRFTGLRRRPPCFAFFHKIGIGRPRDGMLSVDKAGHAREAST